MLDDNQSNPEYAAKMTEWPKEPSVMDLKADLEMAGPAHQTHVSKVKHWLDLRNIEGKAKPKTAKNRSSVQPKLIRRQNEWRYSALTEPLLSTDRLFKVKPRTWEDKEKAVQNGLVLNWQFQSKMNRVKFVDEVVRTFVDEGTVIVRLGWERKTEMVLEEVPIWEFYEAETPEQIQALQQALELKRSNPNAYLDLPEALREGLEYSIEVGEPVYAVQVGVEQAEVEKILENRPTADIIHYENLYLDPTCEGDVEKAGFAIISFETSPAELKKDGRYKNIEKVNWSSESPLHNSEHHTAGDHTLQFRDEARKKAVAYEYWGWYDVEGKGELKPIVATWIGNTMIRMEENPFPDRKLPIVLIPYLPVKRSATGEPDAELLEENQAIMGAVTRGMIDLLGRSANGQTGFAKGMLDVVNRRRYEQGHDYEFNPNVAPSVGVHQHKYPELPQSALTMLGLQNQEAEALTGVKAFSGGLSGEAYGEVAAGIRGMLDAASKREMAILRRLAQGIAEIGRKIMMMNHMFLSDEEVVRVTNEEFIPIRREDLPGQFDLEVDISTAEVDEAQAQDLAFMLQTIGNSMDFSMVQLILSEIARLKRMPELAERIRQFRPEPDPLERRIKELEIAKLEAEIEDIKSDAQLKRAKAMSEMSEADLKNLEFLEQETGTTHARDMDKQRAQAEANQNLEVTKAFLASGEDKPKESQIEQAMGYKKMQALEDMLTDRRPL